MPHKLWKVLSAVLLLICLLCPVTRANAAEEDDTVTITFDYGGLRDGIICRVPRGTGIDPSAEGFAAAQNIPGYEPAGWYYDKAFTKQYSSVDIINMDTTLYVSLDRIVTLVEMRMSAPKAGSLPMHDLKAVSCSPYGGAEVSRKGSWMKSVDGIRYTQMDGGERFADNMYYRYDGFTVSAKPGFVFTPPTDFFFVNGLKAETREWTGASFVGTVVFDPESLDRQTCIVTFEHNGFGGADTQTVVEKGKCVILPENPSEPGLVFAGWYTNPECTKAFDPNQPITSDRVLYAKWNKDPDWNYVPTAIPTDTPAPTPTLTPVPSARPDLTPAVTPGPLPTTRPGWYVTPLPNDDPNLPVAPETGNGTGERAVWMLAGLAVLIGAVLTVFLKDIIRKIEKKD